MKYLALLLLCGLLGCGANDAPRKQEFFLRSDGTIAKPSALAKTSDEPVVWAEPKCDPPNVRKAYIDKIVCDPPEKGILRHGDKAPTGIPNIQGQPFVGGTSATGQFYDIHTGGTFKIAEVVPQDVPAIKVPVKSYYVAEGCGMSESMICSNDAFVCSNNGTMVEGEDGMLSQKCVGGWEWSCKKGSGRILLTDVDGGLHCVKFTK